MACAQCLRCKGAIMLDADGDTYCITCGDRQVGEAEEGPPANTRGLVHLPKGIVGRSRATHARVGDE